MVMNSIDAMKKANMDLLAMSHLADNQIENHRSRK